MILKFSLLLAGMTLTGVALADSQAPSVPDNIQTSALSDSSIRVTWNRPFDDTGVDGYNVYRNGNYYATVFDTNYVDDGASSGNSYQYSVVAFDAARNYSRRSADVQASAGSSSSASPAPAPTSGEPGVPNGLNAQSLGDGRVQLSWNATSGGDTGYNVYRDNSYIDTVRDTTSYIDTGVNAGGSHSYSVVAFNNNGQFSRSSSTLSFNAGSSNSTLSDDSSNGSSSASSSAVPAGYRQVFADEFRGGSIDSGKWNTRYRWGPNLVINQEQQYYVDSQSNPNFGHSPFELDGEHLTINAIRTPDHLHGSANSQPWLSGAMTTFNKFRMRYGYVEMRARLPGGQGLWPAFWLLHQTDHQNRPEIDVVEMVGRDPNTVYQTYHYFENSNLRSTPSFTVGGQNFSSDFHTYGMRWEPGRITWYVDGQETNRFDSGNVSSEDMYLLINLAVGGVWNGDADDSTPSPARFTIDYIRAYAP